MGREGVLAEFLMNPLPPYQDGTRHQHWAAPSLPPKPSLAECLEARLLERNKSLIRRTIRGVEFLE